MRRAFWGCCVLAAALPAVAGNRWMMEQNARELIEMADAVAGQVQGVKPDERLRFEAQVVERDGKRVIHLDRVEVTPVAAQPAAQQATAPATQIVQPQSIAVAPADYRSVIRYAPLLQGQAEEALKSAGAVGGGADLAEVGDFPNLLAQHPEAKAYELKGAGEPSKRSFWVSW